MSLYEQFHSDINKKYMFNMVKTIINREFNKDIGGDNDNYNKFVNTLENIFKENNSDDITVLNKILLDSEVGKYRDKYNLEDKVIVNNNVNKASNIEELIKQREQQNQASITNETSIQQKNNVFGTSIKDLIENRDDKLDDKVDDKVNNNDEIIKVSNDYNDDDNSLKSICINSSQRKNINSSRYNYVIDLNDNVIQSKDIKYVSKMILPIEDNYMFSIPILILNIPELKVSLHMQQEDTISTSKGTFGIYIPINKHEIDTNDVDKLTVQINDITETQFTSHDILKINLVQIQDNKIGLTCSSINKLNYKKGDNIKIINNHTYDLYKLSNIPLQINNIIDNIIYCWLPEKFKNSKYNNCDMKILNLSNQNIIFFNQQI